MSFTIQSEIDLCNQALDKIAAKNITLALQTTQEALVALRHYTPTLNTLSRTFHGQTEMMDQAELSQIKTISLGGTPTAQWAVDDIITGITSGTTATILTVTSGSEYEIIDISGDFTDGETITNATVETVYYDGVEVEYEDETVYYFDSAGTEQINCATGFPDVSAKVPVFKWSYQYQLPSDFRRLIEIEEDDGTDYRGLRWERQGDRILTDYTTLNIAYIKQVTDPDDFDPLFYEIIVLELALKMVSPLVGIKAGPLVETIKDDLAMAMRQAKLTFAQETAGKGRYDWVLAKYGSGISGSTNIDNE